MGASNYHWINYDEDKFVAWMATQMAAARGTRLHALAHDLIRERVRLPRNGKTLNRYVNDCIGWDMIPEQVLRYSDNAFGTADAISFKNYILRISDLKTGVTPASEKQLEVYAAFFCLEYRFKPFDLKGIELRIYQNDEVAEYEGDPVVISLIMDKIISFDKLANQIREESMS